MDIPRSPRPSPIVNQLPTIILVAVVLIALIVFCIAISDQRATRATERQTLYTAWSKIHPDQRLTFDEWMTLYRADLLPGQNRR